MRRMLVLIVTLSLLGAGCIGLPGDDGGEETGPQSEPTTNESEDDRTGEPSNDTEDNETGANDSNASEGNESFGNATANETEGNESEENETEWRYDNRSGTVEGNPPLTEASATEDFTVAEGAEELALNLSADGGELDVCIKAPSGNGSGNESGDNESSCTAEESTEDGNLTWSEEAPTPGEWSVEMTAQGIGPQSVEYELVIGQLVPASAETNSTENETGEDGNYTLSMPSSAPSDGASQGTAWSPFAALEPIAQSLLRTA